MPGRTSRTVVHIIRAATYDGQGVETDLWESDLAPPRKQGGRNTHRTPKGTAPPPDPTVIHTICTLPRRLAMSSGTITLRRPRVRGVEERFESRVLPLFARRTKELVLTSSRTCLKEGSSKTESPSQPNSGRMPSDTFTHLLTQPHLTFSS